MYIQSFSIKGLKWIDIRSGISQIDVNAVNPVQIVIGANGGGKSTLLTQLTPLPANKNDYIKGGYKELNIFHQGNDYVIRSDFESRSGKHSFLKNGIELNISGLTTLQTDLCKEHLGYTPEIDSLTHCRFQITKMSLAERKALLLSLSPATPDFVVQLHKQAKSSLRSCRANLQLLTKRKAEIEEKMMPKDQLDVLQSKLDELNTALTEVINNIFLLENNLAQYEKELKEFGDVKDVDPEKALKYKKRVQQLVYQSDSPDVKGDDYSSELTQLDKEILISKEKCQQAKEKFDRLSQELQQYDKEILDQQDTGRKECEELIQSKLDQLNELNMWMNFPRIKDEYMNKHVEALNTLQLFLENTVNTDFDHMEDNDLYRKVMCIDDVQKKIDYLVEMMNYHQQEILAIRPQVNNIDKILKTIPSGPPKCVNECRNCGYCDYFNDIEKRESEKRRVLMDSLKQHEHKYDKYERAYNKLQKYRREITVIRKAMWHIKDLLRDTVFDCSDELIITNLSSRVLQGDWLSDMQMTLLAQEKLKEVDKIHKEINEAKTTMEALQKLNAPAIKILKKLYEDKQDEFNKVKFSILGIAKQINFLSEKQTLLERLKKLKETGKRLADELSLYHEYTMLKEYVNFLKDSVMKGFMESKEKLSKEIYEITKIQKEQESLKARYKEEITSLMLSISKKENVYQYLELALDPEAGMPQYQLRQFLNAIIANVNFILSRIWTSPFEVKELTNNESVSCDFRASVNDKQLAPLNKLSKSEQAVVNFAFYIAMLYATGNTDFPVFFDEADDGFDTVHKNKYLEWLKSYMESMYSPQLWMVCHDATIYGGLSLFTDVICLNGTGLEIPPEANKNVTIKHS